MIAMPMLWSDVRLLAFVVLGAVFLYGTSVTCEPDFNSANDIMRHKYNLAVKALELQKSQLEVQRKQLIVQELFLEHVNNHEKGLFRSVFEAIMAGVFTSLCLAFVLRYIHVAFCYMRGASLTKSWVAISSTLSGMCSCFGHVTALFSRSKGYNDPASRLDDLCDPATIEIATE